MSKVKSRRIKRMLTIIVLFSFCLTSCNVTRKVTTQSEYMQRGDTAVTIVTKTIESYDATKKPNL